MRSRRAILFSMTLLAALSSIACSGSADDPNLATHVDLVVVNADVRTVDPGTPVAEAFAVTEGRIVAVGPTLEIVALAGDTTAVVDADGSTVIPGLIDGHTHLVAGSGLAVGVDLSEIEDKSEWLRIIREKVQSLPDGAWILGGAWDHNLSDGLLPTKEMLDAVSPDNPVLLRDIDGHSSWANSLAIELAGVTADSHVPQGGRILVDSITGEPTGVFLETASALFNDAPGLREARDPEAGIRAAILLANSYGITGVHDMSGNHDAFLSVMKDGALTVRIWQGTFSNSAIDKSPAQFFLDLDAERVRLRQTIAEMTATETTGPLFELGYVKLMIDGVLSTHTALMKEAYADNPEAQAEPFVSRDDLRTMVAAAHDAGFPVAVHAIGDEGVSWVLDSFAESPRPPGVLMDRVEHIEVVTPDDVQRFNSLGIVASMQPHHATCCIGNYVIARIGRDRMPNAYVWRQMVDNTIPLVLGSDWPTSPLDPLIQIADTLHREARIGGVVQPWDEANRLTFEEALYGYTQAGANMTLWSDDIGSITVGKWADFVILDESLPAKVDRSIENQWVMATYLAGKRVYSKNQ